MSERHMSTCEVLTKLVGPVEPVGESREDEQRLENLEELIHVTNMSIETLRYLANKKSHEHSRNTAYQRARQALRDIQEEVSSSHTIEGREDNQPTEKG